jgi:putative tryptophan/tyrosine transport system substrate-binding protein
MLFDQLKRREFITLLGGAAAAWPLAAWAQEFDRVRQISVLMGVSQSDSDARPRIATFERALQDLGWVSKRNIRIDYRWPAGDMERLQKLAQDVVESGSEIVVATGTAWVVALLRETKTTPIVFVLVSDPVENGFVASLSQPGGNVTGFSNLVGSIGGKWLQTLRELAPRLNRAAMLFNPSTAAGHGSSFWQSFEEAARSFSLTPIAARVQSAADIEAAISALGHEPDGGLVVMSDQFLTVHRELIVTLAAANRVPAIYPFRYFVTNGGLMSYGVSSVDLYRRSASYVDRILRGEKPSELPVQEPTRFELAINLTTAKGLGLEVPPVMLATADEVIE